MESVSCIVNRENFSCLIITTVNILLFFLVWSTQPKAKRSAMQGHHFPSALRRCILASYVSTMKIGNVKRKRTRNSTPFGFWRPHPLSRIDGVYFWIRKFCPLFF